MKSLLFLFSCFRSVFGALVYPLFLFFCSVVCIVQNIIFNNRKWDDAVISFWGRGSCWLFGVKVIVHGFDHYPDEKTGGVFLFNHTSFFDVFAMIGFLPGMRFGAKIELFSIPFFGLAMRRVGMLPIARENRSDVIKVYQAAQKRIEAGEKFALAPEGTRQNEEKLGGFKSGPFIFAINSKAKIFPVVIKGAASILPKGALFPTWGVWQKQIDIYLLPATHAQDFSIDERKVLQDQVRSQMAELFN